MRLASLLRLESDPDLILGCVFAYLLVLLPIRSLYTIALAAFGLAVLAATWLVARQLGAGVADWLGEPMLMAFLFAAPVFVVLMGARRAAPEGPVFLPILAASLLAVALHGVWWFFRYPHPNLQSTRDPNAKTDLRWGIKHGMSYAGCVGLLALLISGVLLLEAFLEKQSVNGGQLTIFIFAVLLLYLIAGLIGGALAAKMRSWVTTPVRLTIAGFVIGALVYCCMMPGVWLVYAMEGRPLDVDSELLVYASMALLLGGLAGPPAAVGRTLNPWLSDG